MKKFLILFFLFPVFVGAQNLVPNPSFEDTVACPEMEAQVYYATGWNSFWSSPDYFNSCSQSTIGYVGIPLNLFGYQTASNGNAYIGVITFANVLNSNIREIIGTQLSSPLIPGTKYYASIKVSLGDSSQFASDKLGISFTTFPNDTNFSYYPINNHAFVFSSLIISDTSIWNIISGSFIADSAYQYVMIGNFFNDSFTNRISVPSLSGSGYIEAYYYIDDVCVSTDSLECDLNPEGIYNENNSEFLVYPNPSSDKIFITIATVRAISVSLINTIGQTVKVYNGRTVDVSDLPNGIYILKINYDNKIIYKKQIIQH